MPSKMSCLGFACKDSEKFKTLIGENPDVNDPDQSFKVVSSMDIALIRCDCCGEVMTLELDKILTIPEGTTLTLTCTNCRNQEYAQNVHCVLSPDLKNDFSREANIVEKQLSVVDVAWLLQIPPTDVASLLKNQR